MIRKILSKKFIFDTAFYVLTFSAVLLSTFFLSRHYVEDTYRERLEQQTKILKDRTYKLSSDGIVILEKLNVFSGKICSEDHLKLIRKTLFSANNVHTIGITDRNGNLICSSMGVHNPPLQLYAIQQTTNRGITVHLKAIISNLGDDLSYIKSNNIVVFFRNATVLDYPKIMQNFSITAVYIKTKNILISDGFFDITWLTDAGESPLKNFSDETYVISSRKSVDESIQYIASTLKSNITKDIAVVFLKMLPFSSLLIICMWISYVFWKKSRNSILSKLKRTLEDDIDLFLEYQPVIDLQTHKCVGAEALVRWKDEDGELVSPAVFIPVAEQNKIMPQLTAKVLKLIEQDCKELFLKYPDFHIAVNISAQDLHSKKVQDTFLSVIAALNVKPGNFIAEVTERELLNSIATRKAFSKIRKLGSTIAIDDFGTGYSSLSYLGEFEIDYLKIDKSFIDTIGTDAPTSKVAVHIIGIAKSLALEMIAEGVETKEQEQYLRENGVQFAQGWLYSKSLRIHHLMRYLDKHH